MNMTLVDKGEPHRGEGGWWEELWKIGDMVEHCVLIP